MDHGTGFRIAGIVERVFAAQSGKFAKVTVSCPDAKGKLQKIDVVAFSDSFQQLANLGQGEEVTITGNVGMEKLTDKQRNEIKIDGYAKWVPMLVAKACKAEKPAAPVDTANDPGWD